MLISTALLNTVIKEDESALGIASSGFRDTTRLSLTDADLALDMLELNEDNFEIYIDKFIENLKELKNMSKMEFINTLKSIQKIRKTMYDDNGKNKLS
jgi:prephenate dehydrogenase